MHCISLIECIGMSKRGLSVAGSVSQEGTMVILQVPMTNTCVLPLCFIFSRSESDGVNERVFLPHEV